jgi:hypothetical protein
MNFLDISAIIIAAALVGKPIWAFYRMQSTKKGPDAVAKYRARIGEWWTGWAWVLF